MSLGPDCRPTVARYMSTDEAASQFMSTCMQAKRTAALLMSPSAVGTSMAAILLLAVWRRNRPSTTAVRAVPLATHAALSATASHSSKASTSKRAGTSTSHHLRRRHPARARSAAPLSTSLCASSNTARVHPTGNVLTRSSTLHCTKLQVTGSDCHTSARRLVHCTFQPGCFVPSLQRHIPRCASPHLRSHLPIQQMARTCRMLALK